MFLGTLTNKCSDWYNIQGLVNWLANCQFRRLFRSFLFQQMRNKSKIKFLIQQLARFLFLILLSKELNHELHEHYFMHFSRLALSPFE